ncbi:hypothetical protein EMIT0P2_10329 [Pseudomonas sp. IT-P2]
MPVWRSRSGLGPDELSQVPSGRRREKFTGICRATKSDRFRSEVVNPLKHVPRQVPHGGSPDDYSDSR